MKTLALVGVKENDINLFDFKRIDRTLNNFHMKQTSRNLNNLRKTDDNKSLRKHAYSNKLKILPPKK